MQQKNCILNTFKCQKIFLNIDQIMKVNSDFLTDLLATTDNFGEMCQKHVNMRKSGLNVWKKNDLIIR